VIAEPDAGFFAGSPALLKSRRALQPRVRRAAFRQSRANDVAVATILRLREFRPLFFDDVIADVAEGEQPFLSGCGTSFGEWSKYPANRPPCNRGGDFRDGAFEVGLHGSRTV